MKKLIFGIIFILILFPTSQSFSQEYTDTNPTLTVSTNSNTNYVYQDSEGYTVVIGVIENNDPLSFVTNVKVQAYFYDEFNPDPLEVKEGSSFGNEWRKRGEGAKEKRKKFKNCKQRKRNDVLNNSK